MKYNFPLHVLSFHFTCKFQFSTESVEDSQTILEITHVLQWITQAAQNN